MNAGAVWAGAAARVVGFAVVAGVVVRWWDAGVLAEPPDRPELVALGVLVVAGFLWLVISGFFGYGAAQRTDWVALVPFVIALVVREGIALHSVEELEIRFARRFYDKHSVVYPLLQLFYRPLVSDAHGFTMHVNGVLGALACLPLYLFVRQRMGSRSAGFACALFLAVHPLVARFSPTDGPQGLLLFAWFSALALLSAPRLEGLGIIGGGILLGMAATLRIEGAILLVASCLLLDMRALAAAAWRHVGAAAFAFLVVTLLVCLQMHFVLRYNLPNVPPLPPARALLSPAGYGGPVPLMLVIVALVSRPITGCWLGLCAGAAMLLVTAPVAYSDNPVAMHRMVPAFALQALLAGIGAHALTAWLPREKWWLWMRPLPAAVAAILFFFQQRADLARQYVFNVEYDLVRRHLAPGGRPASGCTLMAFNAGPFGDIDLHDFGQVVPGVRVINCNEEDCTAKVERKCLYYVRSAACYFHPAGLPQACAQLPVAAGEARRVCLGEPAASFEARAALEPVERRIVDLWETFGEYHGHYPRRAEIALFRVHPAGR